MSRGSWIRNKGKCRAQPIQREILLQLRQEGPSTEEMQASNFLSVDFGPLAAEGLNAMQEEFPGGASLVP